MKEELKKRTRDKAVSQPSPVGQAFLDQVNAYRIKHNCPEVVPLEFQEAFWGKAFRRNGSVPGIRRFTR